MFPTTFQPIPGLARWKPQFPRTGAYRDETAGGGSEVHCAIFPINVDRPSTGDSSIQLEFRYDSRKRKDLTYEVLDVSTGTVRIRIAS